MFLKTSKNYLDYAVLTPNLWQQHFKMFEIMKSCVKEKASSSLSSSIGYKHTPSDIANLKRELYKMT